MSIPSSRQSPESQVPPNDVSSEEALDFVQKMQTACATYPERADGKQLIRAYLSQWDREERRRIALRIMTDLMQGKTAAGESLPSDEAARSRKP
jgi:hypothetical protein